MKKPKIRKVVVFSDVHLPNEDQQAVSTMLRFIKDFKPDEIVINGDLMDFASISRHDGLHEEIVEEDLGIGNFFFDVLQRTAPQAKLHYNFGNHCLRLQSFVENNAPQLRGLLTLEKELNLKARGVSFLPYASDKLHWLTDKLAVHHGFAHGAHYTKTTLDKFQVSTIVGHCHRPLMHSAPTVGRKGHQVRGCWGLGCLVPVDHVSYMTAPPGWCQGFGVVTINEDTQNFNVYPVIMSEKEFMWTDGTVYKPSSEGWRYED